MKAFLLSIILFGLLGFVFDYSVRKLQEEKGFIKKLISLKQLLNIFIYGIGGGLMFLIAKIGIFSKLGFLPLYLFTGAIVISIVEFGFGYLFNILLKLDIWNYKTTIKLFNKTIPLNILGQVDIIHFILWGLLSIPIYFIKNIVIWLAG